QVNRFKPARLALSVLAEKYVETFAPEDFAAQIPKLVSLKRFEQHVINLNTYRSFKRVTVTRISEIRMPVVCPGQTRIDVHVGEHYSSEVPARSHRDDLSSIFTNMVFSQPYFSHPPSVICT